MGFDLKLNVYAPYVVTSSSTLIDVPVSWSDLDRKTMSPHVVVSAK